MKTLELEPSAFPSENFSANIDTGDLILDSCARDSLSPVFIHQQTIGGNPHAIMRIVDGDTSQTMWQVDIGAIDLEVKSPIIFDVEGDGTLEIIVVYDVNGQATVELWSPIIECDVTGWKPAVTNPSACGDGVTIPSKWPQIEPAKPATGPSHNPCLQICSLTVVQSWSLP